MDIWQIWCILGVILIILEMFTPALFFLNLAVAAFTVAVVAFLGFNFTTQVIIYLAVSVALILFFRPILVKKFGNNGSSTGIKNKYINNIAKVVREVNKFDGRIAIYGEEWDAKTTSEYPIPVGSKVKIISNESLIMYVEKYEE